MAEQTITNPYNYHVKVTDPRTGVDDNGGELAFYTRRIPVVADGAITRGQVVALNGATATKLPRVVASDTVDSRVIGIATADATAGTLTEVAVEGFALALAGETLTAADVLTSNTDSEVMAATPTATTVVGTLVGFSLGTGDDGDLVPIYVRVS